MDLYKDTKEQEDINNLITSVSEHNVHDGQKRYKTMCADTSSNYPRPKTLFYVRFNCKEGIENYSQDLSKYLIEINKPTINITSTKMNQYNRIKYVIENVEYGDLKLTFMDVKDDPIEKAFFTYLSNILIDFNRSEIFQEPDSIKYYGRYKWGLTTNSNDRKIISIDIAEMFMDKLLIYTIENPILSSVDFGTNKIGDYSPNQIVVNFKIEGIIMKYSGRINKAQAHEFQKRWVNGFNFEANKVDIYDPTAEFNENMNLFDALFISNEKYIKQANETYNKLKKEENKNNTEIRYKTITDYLNYPNKGDYIWIYGDSSSMGLRTPRDRTFFMSGLNKVTNMFDF